MKSIFYFHEGEKLANNLLDPSEEYEKYELKEE